MTYMDLFVFSMADDVREFSARADRTRYLAMTPANLLERLRGLELRDVVVDPEVRLTPHARQEIRARMRAPSAYLHEPTHSEFAELVQGAVAP